eukprot:6291502-Amphidinium_carterae.1
MNTDNILHTTGQHMCYVPRIAARVNGKVAWSDGVLQRCHLLDVLEVELWSWWRRWMSELSH